MQNINEAAVTLRQHTVEMSRYLLNDDELELRVSAVVVGGPRRFEARLRPTATLNGEIMVIEFEDDLGLWMGRLEALLKERALGLVEGLVARIAELERIRKSL
jgi:hypothetical protein